MHFREKKKMALTDHIHQNGDFNLCQATCINEVRKIVTLLKSII